MSSAKPCFGCKYTDCVVVCPVECFYEDEQMLYIHPDECIDCEACVPECPVDAIFHEDNVPDEWKDYIQAERGKGAAMSADHGKERAARRMTPKLALTRFRGLFYYPPPRTESRRLDEYDGLFGSAGS